MEIWFRQLQRALHGIAEEHGTVPARRDDKPVVAERVPRRMARCQPGRDAQHVAVERLEPPGSGKDLHDLPAAVVGIGTGDEPLPVGGAVTHDGVGEVRDIVHDQPANVVDVEVAAHHDVDVPR